LGTAAAKTTILGGFFSLGIDGCELGFQRKQGTASAR
jgi:hypothetical protein